MGIHFTRSPKIRRAPTKTVVRFDATNEDGTKDTYYGYIDEIWELDYGPTFKVPLFRCSWVNMNVDGIKVDQLYGMTTVDLKNLGHTDDPFVLAKDVAQVFYVKDMSSRPKKKEKQGYKYIRQ